MKNIRLNVFFYLFSAVLCPFLITKGKATYTSMNKESGRRRGSQVLISAKLRKVDNEMKLEKQT